MRLTTEILQSHSKNICGKDTIKVVDNGTWIYVYHYGALICVIDPNDEIVVYNQMYFVYSAATSKMRNKAVELCGLSPMSTQELRKIQQGKKSNCIHYIYNIMDYRDEDTQPQIDFVKTL